MSYTQSRISKLRDYLFGIIESITSEAEFQIGADFLGDVGDYSLDKIPTESTVEKWILGLEIHRDVYSFRSRKYYSQDTSNNLTNIGFFELFEERVKKLNEEGTLPSIEGIESVECLNCGTLVSIEGTECTFDIQIQITYRDTDEGGTPSL